MNVHIPSPALDSAETVSDPIATPATLEPDWSRLVTPGHVLRSRLMQKVALSLGLAWGAAAVVFTVASIGPELAALKMPPSFYINALVNPATWVKMPDGSLTSYRLEWLSKIPAQAGLPAASWTAFVNAVREDVSNHGSEYSAWQSVPALATAPRITRPEKVFDPATLDRLSTSGTVAIEADGRGVDAVSYVDGRMSWIQFGAYGRCRIVTGPEVEGCSDGGGFKLAEIIEHVEGFKPAPAAASATTTVQE